MEHPILTESAIRASSTPQSFERGQELYRRDATSNAARHGDVLTGECEGTMAPYYNIRVELDEGGIRSASCTCEYAYGGYCKHIVALLLAYIHQPDEFTEHPAPEELLNDLDRDDLIALLARLMRDHPELADWVEITIAAPKQRSKKSRAKPIDEQIYRRQVRSIMHSLDRMRMSEAYWHIGGMVNQLREMQQAAMNFLDAGDPDTALAILFVLAEEAGQGIEFIDDSDGELGSFAISLGQPMAEAILSREWSAAERKQLLARLKKLDKGLDDYGMSGLDVAIEAAQYGWDAPVASPYALHTREQARDEGEYVDVDEDAHWRTDSDADNDITEAKLNVLQRQGRTDEYLVLCQTAARHLRYAMKLCDLGRVDEAAAYAIAHLSSSEESLALAKRLRESGRVDDAIRVGEHGLQHSGRKAELGEWLAAIEESKGRYEQALQAWLAAFPEAPSRERYQAIQRLARSQWQTLQPQLMQMLGQHFDKRPLVEVLLAEQKWDEAMQVAERDAGYSGVRALVADAVMPHRPDWVIALSLKDAEALIGRKESKYYRAAAEWLERAKRAYGQMGRGQEWLQYLQQLKETFKRRPALQEQLRRL